MSNGAESNSVVEQQIQQQESAAAQAAVEDKEQLKRLKAEQARKVQALNLMRARVSEQLARTSNERYQQLLQSELAQIESELAKLV